jgi:hypothetical protein
MNLTSETISGRKVVFDHVIEDYPGGASFDLSNVPADTEYIAAGTPVYIDKSARVAYLVKTATIVDASDADKVYIDTPNLFSVGDHVYDGATAQTITAITASGDDMDLLALDGDLSTTGDGTVLTVATDATTATALHTPNALVKDDIYVGDGVALVGNAEGSYVIGGSVRESALTYPLSTTQKTALAKLTFNY